MIRYSYETPRCFRRENTRRRAIRPTVEGLDERVVLSALTVDPGSVLISVVPTDTTIHNIPLTDPGGGGLYGGNSNVPPPPLLEAAIAGANRIQPLGQNGKPSPKGRTGVIVIGESVTRLGFAGLPRHLRANRGAIAPGVAFAYGAQDGVVAQNWSQPGKPWSVLASDVHHAGLSNRQVQVLLLDSTIANPWRFGPNWQGVYQGMLTNIVRIAESQYPNLRLVYISSDYYAGYTNGSEAQAEPYAYDTGLVVRNLVLSQVQGGTYTPLLRGTPILWGPYLWADGQTPRAVDGLTWNPGDYLPGGIHETPAGQAKYSGVIYSFLTHDVTASRWFLRHSS